MVSRDVIVVHTREDFHKEAAEILSRGIYLSTALKTSAG